MPVPEQSLQVATQPIPEDDLVQSVLDTVPVTDTVYHHLAFTRPLVDSLVREVRRIAPTGRVLVIGPNELLPRVLLELGYELDVWVLDGLPLSDDVLRHASRQGPMDEVLVTGAEHPADVVVIPYVAESARLEPPELLRALQTCVKGNGHVLMACRQPGELRRRVHRIVRKVNPTIRADRILTPSPTWPSLPARRLLSSRDLERAADGQFALVRKELVIDHRAYLTLEALNVWEWLLKELYHLAKVAVPGFRDCTMVTLAPTGDARLCARLL